MKTSITVLALALAAAFPYAANAAEDHVVSRIPLGGDKSRLFQMFLSSTLHSNE
jgi:hypothetical protein